MKKHRCLLFVGMFLFGLVGCSKSNGDFNQSSGTGNKTVDASTAYFSIEIDSFRNSNGTVYITNYLSFKRNVSSYSNLEVSFRGTYQLSVLLSDNSSYRTTLSSGATFRNSQYATCSVYVNVNKRVLDVESIRATYNLTKVSGTLDLK